MEEQQLVMLSREEIKHQVLALPPEQRYPELVRLQNANFEARTLLRQRCPRCALQLQFCVCKEVETHTTEVLGQHLRPSEISRGTLETVHFVVLMHNREFFRASNTGKLISIAFPHTSGVRQLPNGLRVTAEVVKAGVEADERHLFDLLEHPYPLTQRRDSDRKDRDSDEEEEEEHEEEEGEAVGADSFKRSEQEGAACPPLRRLTTDRAVVVLYPGKGCVGIEGLFQPVGPTSSPSTSPTSLSIRGLVAVLLDGTWSQAKRLNKVLPDSLPRVKLNAAAVSKFLLRRQSSPGRIATVEAAALLLEQLPTVPSISVDKGDVQLANAALLDSLGIIIRQLAKQTHRNDYASRNNHMLKYRGGGRTVPKIERVKMQALMEAEIASRRSQRRRTHSRREEASQQDDGDSFDQLEGLHVS